MRTPDHARQILGEFGSHRDPVMPQVGTYERHDLTNEIIHIKLDSLLAALFQHPANAADDLARPPRIANNALEHRTRPLHIRRVLA